MFILQGEHGGGYQRSVFVWQLSLVTLGNERLVGFALSSYAFPIELFSLVCLEIHVGVLTIYVQYMHYS